MENTITRKDILQSADWHYQEARIYLNERRPNDSYAQTVDLERVAQSQLRDAAHRYAKVGMMQHVQACWIAMDEIRTAK